jgi:NADPH-dependent 2,4-dienoyl-CoA reductase/sulfur reductase-like enzyme
MKHVVIIGNGIAGITAARHIRKQSDHRITVISGETEYFFSRTALMYVYMGHMKFEHTKPYEDRFWKKNRIDLLKAFVSKVDFPNNRLICSSGETIQYDDLILAVGSKPNRFGWPGQELDGVQGLYSYQDLQLMEKNTTEHKVNRAVIVGGGLIGVEMAEMLMTRGIKVTFLIREARFWGNVLPEEDGKLVERHMRSHHVDLRFDTELSEIIGDESGRAVAIKTNKDEEISCEFIGLTAGVSPNVDFLKDTELEIERGIVVNQYLETNLPNVFAIGDCAQNSNPAKGRRPIEQVWYTGRMMGETLARTICGDQTAYKPGIWFNSAKFFDIEYQTYGEVLSELKEGQKQFYWEDSKGRIGYKMIFEKDTGKVIGVNVFGMRMRHEIWDSWLRSGKDADFVMAHLRDANFDPEFYKKYEKDIVSKYNQQTGASVQLKRKNWSRLLSKNY